MPNTNIKETNPVQKPSSQFSNQQGLLTRPVARTTMKIALLQLAPVFKDAEKSRIKADVMLEKLNIEAKIDLVICPEMAFSGYMFTGKSDIAPHTEDEKGETYRWCAKHAVRLNCFVMAGYPQKVTGENGEVKYYNSACFVDPSGTLLLTYQKSFLYDTDKTWAEEGSGFRFIDVPEIGRIGFGICMDINPKDFVAPFELKEFANYHLANSVDLIAFSSAWLSSEGSEFDTIQYWGNRLSPLFGKKCFFALANRIGIESGTKFAGNSCVIDLGRKVLLGVLDSSEEGVLTVNIPSLRRKTMQ